MLTLDCAALTLYEDPRRADALRAESAAGNAARLAMDDISRTAHAIFDYRYCSVGGSVQRRTHLPGESDLDITLALIDATWCGPYRDTPFDAAVEDSLIVYATRLGQILSTDENVCDAFAHMRATTSRTVCQALATAPQLKKWPDGPLLVAKFVVNGGTFLEIGLGDMPWHYIGLRYNEVWKRQIETLPDAQRETTVSQILLAKFLFKRRGLYGEKGRLPNVQPNSRRIEQLVMRPALAGSTCPLLDACRTVLSVAGDFDRLLACFTLPEAAFPDGISDAQLMGLNETEQTLANWVVLQRLAADVTSNSLDFQAELVA